ncbi:hypothetical protein DL764_009454 [Monosporascus ibericus]|uniref:FAS1 domain-containing protein n=1 Tax=Monosporascus ibericus TaxID=155417 RepID=A0A4Q4SXQ9_9PEZI|nr:hypothetical protein DL764_009454 [Monosporascus ibericus]
MRLSTLAYFQILIATASAQLVAAPFGLALAPHNHPQQPLMAPEQQGSDSKQPQPPPQPQVQQPGVMLSDVMGRDRSMNVFAGFARDSEAVARRLDDAARNSTVLAPLNSAIDGLPRKPWEDPGEYRALGADAYEGDDGRDRARRNLRRFVEAHVVPASPWPEGEKRRTLLEGDRDIWWETRDGVRVIQPDNIDVASIASRVGNGEVWILKGVRNYA